MELAGDDHGHSRTGNVWTATSHAVTAVIGSGVLALPWSVAQMGWIAGPLVLLACAYVTYFTATLLCDCYRYPDPVNGRRNPTYMDAVRSFLGPKYVVICAIAQYAMLWGSMIGYTVTAPTSMTAINRTDCLHFKGHDADCSTSGNLYIILFGIIEVVMSQFPNLEKITIVSVVAALMSFTYSFIVLFLCLSKLVANHSPRGTILGVEVGVHGISPLTKIWHVSQSLGNVAFAYTYSMLLIEIQDTLRSPPPENQTMKRASFYGIMITTAFYVAVGCSGYAAFGNEAPGNILTRFYEPFWLVDIANIAVTVHLIGAYQVFAQPVFAKYENYLTKKCPQSAFFHKKYKLPIFKSVAFRFTAAKLLLRSCFVVLTTVIAMMLPFFNAIVGLLGAIAFWPLTVYFPVSMYKAQAKIERGQWRWFGLQCLSAVALIISCLAASGSIADIAMQLKHATFFKAQL